jgi:putative GTP pyrophosphokinase
VTDLVGARVITYFADDVDRVARIIRNLDNFEIDPRNSVDKRRALQADQFGYQSLHLVALLSKRRIFTENREFEGLKIEIQIRSLLQHTWAEIEHAYYKAERTLPGIY